MGLQREFIRQATDIEKNKWHYTETFWNTDD